MGLEEWIKEQLKLKGIHYFYYFCHIDNFENIVKNGILPRNETVKKSLLKIDAADQTVISFRHSKVARFSSNNTRNICDAVPLYLIPNTPTFYKHKEKEKFIFLLINSFIISKINEVEYVFTDGNAANLETNFFYNLKKLDQIPWDILRSTDVDFNDKIIIRKRCSEFLIFPKIDFKEIWKIAVLSENQKEIVNSILAKNGVNKDIEIKSEYYY